MTKEFFGAIRENDITKFQEFIDSGGDVNVEDKYGDTALIYAAQWGDEDIVELLIKHGADVNAKDKHSRTALSASILGKKKIAELLINAGADVNARDYQCKTALMWASIGCHTEMVKLLKQHGAN